MDMRDSAGTLMSESKTERKSEVPAPLRPLRGLQETRVATQEESGVLGFPSRRGLTPRGFLLQCMKVKSESEVAQSCPTFSDPMDCSLQAPPSMGFSRQDYWSGVPSYIKVTIFLYFGGSKAATATLPVPPQDACVLRHV